MITYCQDCAHVHEKKGPSYTWLCMKFPRHGGEGYVTKKHWDDDPPYRRCYEINKHGACPLFERDAGSQMKMEEVA